jgi:hypothetical protein
MAPLLDRRISSVKLLHQTGDFVAGRLAKLVVSAAFLPAQVQMHEHFPRSTPTFAGVTSVATLSWFQPKLLL